jgi:3,4-dihydroxy 2-butanone 4-phosphate synthase
MVKITQLFIKHIFSFNRFLKGTTTGVSAADRTATIKVLLPIKQNQKTSEDRDIFFASRDNGGVLKRAGHTEAAVDLQNLPD